MAVGIAKGDNMVEVYKGERFTKWTVILAVLNFVAYIVLSFM